MSWYEELDTKLQSIRLTAWHLLAYSIPQVQPQRISVPTILMRQAKVVCFNYSQQATNL